MDAAPAADTVTLGFGFSFADLAGRDGLVRLDRIFLERLAGDDAALHARLLAARAAPDALATPEESDLVVALAPHLDGFVAALFGIEAETLALAHETHALDPIHACKRLFVQRQAVKKYADPSQFDGAALRADLEARLGETLTERAFADHVAAWEKAGETAALDVALRYAAWATLTAGGPCRASTACDIGMELICPGEKKRNERLLVVRYDGQDIEAYTFGKIRFIQ